MTSSPASPSLPILPSSSALLPVWTPGPATPIGLFLTASGWGIVFLTPDGREVRAASTFSSLSNAQAFAAAALSH